MNGISLQFAEFKGDAAELARRFSLEHVGHSAAVFDRRRPCLSSGLPTAKPGVPRGTANQEGPSGVRARIVVTSAMEPRASEPRRASEQRAREFDLDQVDHRASRHFVE